MGRRSAYRIKVKSGEGTGDDDEDDDEENGSGNDDDDDGDDALSLFFSHLFPQPSLVQISLPVNLQAREKHEGQN